MRNTGNKIALLPLLPLLGIIALLAAGAHAQPRDVGSWTELSPMPRANAEFENAVIDGKIYSAGGFLPREYRLLTIYDPVADSWSTGPNLPIATHHSGVVAVGGRLYVLGGSQSENEVQIFDPIADSWSLGTPMPTPRTAAVAIVLDDRIHVLAGATDLSLTTNAKTDHEVYDPETDRWETRAPLPFGTEHAYGGEIDGKLYVVGGRNGPENLNKTQIYDPATDSWSAGATLPVRVSGMAVAVVEGELYVFGGEDIPGNLVRRTTQRYNPKLNRWQFMAEMPVRLHGNAGTALDGRIYIFGGASLAGRGEGIDRAFRYDPPVEAVPEPPRKPKRLRTKVLSPTEVRLKWKDKSKDETSFEVQIRRRGEGGFEVAVTLSPNVKRTVIAGLEPGATYIFRVRARNAAGFSKFSNKRTATTPE